MEQRTDRPGGSRPPATRQQPGTVRIGQIAGVDVLVRSSWLLVAVFLSVVVAPRVEGTQPGLGPWKYVAGLAFAVLLYLTVLLHEASHAVMAQHYGLQYVGYYLSAGALVSLIGLALTHETKDAQL